MLMSTTLLSMILSIAVNEVVNVLFYMILLPKFSLFFNVVVDIVVNAGVDVLVFSVATNAVVDDVLVVVVFTIVVFVERVSCLRSGLHQGLPAVLADQSGSVFFDDFR